MKIALYATKVKCFAIHNFFSRTKDRFYFSELREGVSHLLEAIAMNLSNKSKKNLFLERMQIKLVFKVFKFFLTLFLYH